MFGAVDIGGTKTLVAVFDKHGKVIEQVKFPTPQDYENFKIQLAKHVANLSTHDFAQAVVAAPGNINRNKGVVLACGNLPWQIIPLEADCEKIFMAPVLVENDAKLAGLSEAVLINNDYTKVLYVTLSTGIGIAVINDGVIDMAVGDSGGHEMLIEFRGEHETWEKLASGKAIAERYGKRASEIEDPAIWKEISMRIAVGLIELIAIVQPEVIIIGGGVGTHFKKYGDILKEMLSQYETPMLKIPPVVPAQKPEEAVIYGCYEFAKQHYEKRHNK